MLALGRTLALAVFVGGLFALATMAWATPPVGQETSAPVIGSLDPVRRVHADGVRLRTRSRMEVATLTVTLAPGGSTGWHRHPGVLVATVHSGAVVRQVACQSRAYRAGQAFVEHGDQPTGQVVNASATEPAVFSVTQIAPPGHPRREESEPPECRGED